MTASLDVKAFLEQTNSFFSAANRGGIGINGYGSLYDFVLKNGRTFTNAKCPAKYKTMARKRQCYSNAYYLASLRGLLYVEGYAAGIIPVSHAWCVEPGSDKVIDPTWALNGYDDAECGYFGVPIKLSYIESMLVATREHRSIIDDWQRQWPILSDPECLWKETL